MLVLTYLVLDTAVQRVAVSNVLRCAEGIPLPVVRCVGWDLASRDGQCVPLLLPYKPGVLIVPPEESAVPRGELPSLPPGVG